MRGRSFLLLVPQHSARTSRIGVTRAGCQGAAIRSNAPVMVKDFGFWLAGNFPANLVSNPSLTLTSTYHHHLTLPPPHPPFLNRIISMLSNLRNTIFNHLHPLPPPLHLPPFINSQTITPGDGKNFPKKGDQVSMHCESVAFRCDWSR